MTLHFLAILTASNRGSSMSRSGRQRHDLERSPLVRCRSPGRGLCHRACFQSSHGRTEGWYENNVLLWNGLRTGSTGLSSRLCSAGGPVSFILMAPSGFSHKNLWGYQQVNNRLLVNVLTHWLKGRKKPEQQAKSLFRCYSRVFLLPSAGPASSVTSCSIYFFFPWVEGKAVPASFHKIHVDFFPPQNKGEHHPLLCSCEETIENNWFQSKTSASGHDLCTHPCEINRPTCLISFFSYFCVQNGFAVVRPPGHHAEESTPM